MSCTWSPWRVTARSGRRARGCRAAALPLLCVFGALWRRRATPGGSPTLWLFIRPTVDRTSTDEMVISVSPIYSDCDSHVVAEIVPPAPSDASDAASKGNKAKKKGDALDEPERAAFKLLCELGKPSTAAEGATAAKAKKPRPPRPSPPPAALPARARP